MHDGYIQEEVLRPPLSDQGFEFFKMRTLPKRVRATQTQTHDAIELIYMKTGSVIASIDGKSQIMRPGDLALFRSRCIHNIYTLDDEENDYYVLKIMPKLIYDVSPKTLLGRFPLRFTVYNPDIKVFWSREELVGSEIERIFGRLISQLEIPNPISEISIIISALHLLEEIYLSDYSAFSKIVSAPYGIFDSLIYINSHFNEDISAEMLAERANMSYGNFSRAFTKATHKNFRDYLNDIRTNHAEQLIVNTELPITEISAQSGYQNVTHFITMYKRLKGITPLAQRKRAKERAKTKK